MKEILNVNNMQYAKECLVETLNIGLEFKLNNDFKEKNILVKTLKNY